MYFLRHAGVSYVRCIHMLTINFLLFVSKKNAFLETHFLFIATVQKIGLEFYRVC